MIRGLAVAVLAFVLGCSSALGATYTLPSTIPADCSRDTSVDLNNWLASVPENSTAAFPSNGCFTGSQTIYLVDRHSLTVDGNGSTFHLTSQGNTKTPFRSGWNLTGGNWLLLRGDHITLRNIHAVGSFPLAGQPISLTNESAQPGYAEYMSNYGVYGTSYATIQNSSGSAPWGDTLTSGIPSYVDNDTSPIAYTSNLLADNLTSSSTSRDCFALTSGQTMTVQHSSCAHAWYGGSDEEADAGSHTLTGVRLLSNAWSDYNLFAVAIPVAGPNIGTFTIEGNTFGPSGNAASPCASAVTVGGYHSGTIANVVTDYNDFTGPSDATMVSYQDVAGGEVAHNKLIAAAPRGCGTAAGPAPLVAVAQSQNVTVSDNGTGAAGAAGYNTSPPPTTAPTLSVTGTTSAPSRTSVGLSWTSVSGATAYNIYVSRSASSGFFQYSTLASSPGAIYDLSSGTWYVKIRAVVNGVEGGDSNVVSATV